MIMALAKIKCLSNFRNIIIYSRVNFTKCLSSRPEWLPKQIPTHTDQVWEDTDYRNARFIDKPKHVNKNFAINLIAEVPPIESTKRVVSCDGGGGATGHPKIYINLDKPGNHTCGYCGLRFFKKDCH